MSKPWRYLVPAALMLVMIAAIFWLTRAGHSVPAKPPAATYVGAHSCVACHAKESDAWRESQHARAMQAADEKTVLGDFSGTEFTHADVTSRFFRRDGKFFITTDGPDGKTADFEIKYTFGLEPLQQYLIELPGGRMQALGIAWDTRPRAVGGQRWFHLYPEQKLKAGHPLHWSGIDQNWNYQCADCHSTDLRKRFDEKTGHFATTWAEMNVSCEACHGPGSNHVAWAGKQGGWRHFESDKGLTAALDERKGSAWTIAAATGNATRSRPRESAREIETCARCHARRGQFSEDFSAGKPLHDAFRPSLIEPGLYHPDGQQRDEVYTYGSFLQSKMHAAGVSCSDCHEPHGGKLRASGNAVCAQCHATAKYDAPAHHHHQPGSTGSACAACHMPTTTYMGVDPRHDHGFRIPRPDRGASLGTPDACTACHREKKPQWAAAALRAWFPQANPGFQVFAEAFHAAERGTPGAQAALAGIVENRAQPPFVRASALARLGAFPSSATRAVAVKALDDADVNVRMAAVDVLSAMDPATRLETLPRMLGDPSRVVRMDAARALAGGPEARLTTTDRAAFNAALAEYVAAQRFNADRPEGQSNLGGLYLAQGKTAEADAALRKALVIDPGFIQAAVNLADLQRTQGRELEAERALRESLLKNPGAASLHHALGLSLVRQKRLPDALDALAKAARLDPGNARFAYVYAIALHDTGRPELAIKTLEAALARQPYDRALLSALAAYEREAGKDARAAERERLLRELEPAG